MRYEFVVSSEPYEYNGNLDSWDETEEFEFDPSLSDWEEFFQSMGKDEVIELAERIYSGLSDSDKEEIRNCVSDFVVTTEDGKQVIDWSSLYDDDANWIYTELLMNAESEFEDEAKDFFYDRAYSEWED